ncbi:MAG: SIR2 family protein [Elusimicrobiota bacterium]
MIDPMISLSFTIQSNPGTYALLLGSGVSRSAGIPTGWEIVIDLIKKLAAVQKKDCMPSPEKWYVEKYKREPDYSEILEEIVKTPIERNQLLRAYFEPNDDEKSKGLKVPTEAHKCIAKLVANGYIKIIVTTNFDRLLEKALEDIGIIPTVISTPDSVEGAIPIIHSKCTIVKVSGDYLDTRIKNTQKELFQYDKKTNLLLDKIFDEFGLIVCGWSAEWDAALVSVIERCKNHRFSAYWTAHGDLAVPAKKLIELRRASILDMKSADEFFHDLTEKIFVLQEISKPHPLSSKIAVATVKKYIIDDKYKISLHDLIMNETEKVYSEILNNPSFSVHPTQFDVAEFNKRVKDYESLIEVLRDMFIAGCFWDEGNNSQIWQKSLERLSYFETQSGITAYLKLRLHPALILLYAGGIAAIASKRYFNFTTLLTNTKIYSNRHEIKEPLILHLYTHEVIEKELANKLPNQDRKYVPLNEHLYALLRQPLKEYIPNDKNYDEIFDRFEYLMALIYADLREKIVNDKDFWGPIGRFGWKYKIRISSHNILVEVDDEIKKQGKEWAPLKVGLFNGSVERLNQVITGFKERLNKLNWY